MILISFPSPPPPLSHSPTIYVIWYSNNFPILAADEISRANFVQNCIGLINEYDFDGIDIDWEYPGYDDHGGTPNDTMNFNSLLRDLRSALDALGDANDGRTYGLTAALPCGPSNIDNLDVPTVSGYLTELNLMTYGKSEAHSSSPPPLYSNSLVSSSPTYPTYRSHHAFLPSCEWTKPPGRFPRFVGCHRRRQFSPLRFVLRSRSRMERGRVRT
jgi:hypothetical protein